MSNFQFQNPDTALLHAGQEADPTTGSRAVPIYQTTSYVFRDTEHAQNLFGLAEPGNIYSRIMNPTVGAFEERVAALEDGAAAVGLASGMAAITFSILNVASAGDEVITDSNLYGGTYNLFANTLPKYGINVKFVDGTDLEQIEAAITDKTKAIFGETITNPSLNVLDIEAIGEIAHKNGIPFIIDNTFAPYISKPLTWGADIVVHSATKWIGGHGSSIGGVVVDGGRFNWDNKKFPGFTEPDESYHGVRFADLGATAFATKLRVQLLRDIGAPLSPFNTFLLLQGLETLHLRMERHAKNTEEVVEYLKNHPAVEWINYPGIEGQPSYDLAKKYFNNSFGSIITFGIKGGRESGRKLIDNISLWSHVANVGDAKSLIIHPASTTHQQLNAEELKTSGVKEELVRLSIGLESPKDILADLDRAIQIATGESGLLEDTDDTAIEWLLSSPFDRAEGVRQKVIATVGADDEAINKLRALGFQITSLKDTDNVDALWVSGEKVPAETIEQLINKQAKILFADNAQDQAIENAKAAGITVITNKNPLDEALRLRANK